MELEEILKIIKEDFQDKSIDISESGGLLMDTIDDVMNRINEKIVLSYTNGLIKRWSYKSWRILII